MDDKVSEDSEGMCDLRTLKTSDINTTQKENVTEFCNANDLCGVDSKPDCTQTLSLSQELDNTKVPQFVCEKCNRVFKQRTRYERHISNHPSEKQYLCTTCQKTFTRISHLEKHMRTHSEERRHVCNICGAAFILPHHLTRHNMVHTGLRPFQCKVCNKQFTRKAGLAQHEYVHTGIRPFVCEVKNCEKLFTDRSTLRRHLLTHSREKPFLCKQCKKTFRTKSACRKHYLRHFKDVESFKCGICEEMFVCAKLLEEHHSLSHDEKKDGPPAYRCGFCLRVFISQSDLDAHVPLHQSGMKYICEEESCAAKFYTEADMILHMETHSKKLNPLCNAMSANTVQQSRNYKLGIGAVEKIENLAVGNCTELVNEPTTNDMNCNKVVVVLQLPAVVKDCNVNAMSSLEASNLQHFLGSAQIDKLLVTTDEITTNSSSTTLSLQLSHDQQRGIQQILQNASFDSMDDIDGLGPIDDLDQNSIHQDMENMTASNTLSESLSPLDLDFEMKDTMSVNQSQNFQTDKVSNSFIMDPGYEQSASQLISFPSSDDDLNIRKLTEEPVVFLGNKSLLQEVILAPDGVEADLNNNNNAMASAIVNTDNLNGISSFSDTNILYWANQERT